jgi:hypothetical protein
VEASSFPALDKPESRFGIEFSAVEFPAAIQTRHRPLDSPDPRKFLPATRTSIEETPFSLVDWERQGMTARFIGDAEIAAGAPPFRAVRRNPAAPGAELRQQMRQLMAQSAIDFRGVVLAETRIERNEVSVRIRAAGGAEKSRVPFHVNFSGEFFGAKWTENFARSRFEGGIASQNDERWLRRKNEIELPKQRHKRSVCRRSRIEHG